MAITDNASIVHLHKMTILIKFHSKPQKVDCSYMKITLNMKSSLFCLYEFCSLGPRDSGSESPWVQEFESVLRIIKVYEHFAGTKVKTVSN